MVGSKKVSEVIVAKTFLNLEIVKIEYFLKDNEYWWGCSKKGDSC